MGIFDAKTSMKGQVTVPVEIRKLLGLESGGKIQFQVQDDGQIKVLAKKRSIKDLKGLVASPKDTVNVKTAIQKAVAKRAERAARP